MKGTDECLSYNMLYFPIGKIEKEESAMSDDPKKDETKQKTAGKKENRLSIPLRLIPNEAEALAREMQAIFDEDKVVHRQGSSEPERD